MIHAPYSVSQKLKQYLADEERLVWHTRDNRTSVVEEFLDSEPEDGQVLVGSGLYEGLDLVDDTARWQVITKIPYPSLYDPAIRTKLEQDQQWYSWAAIRPLLQASGRISRGPSDYGVSFIVDNSFKRLYENNKDLFPDWWTAAVLEEKV
jgi:Rad3-related DNA helicase